MPTITITVTDKVASLTSDSVIVCGNSDYEIEFTFDSEWTGYTTKTLRIAYIKKGAKMYQDVLFNGTTVAIPALYGVNECAIGVYAGNIHTTTPALIPCSRCITDGEPTHDPPSPDVYNQLLEYLAGLQGGGNPVHTATAIFDLAATGTVQTATETPPTVHITCDEGYYFDSAVTCTLNGNQRQKSNSTPAIGVIAHFFGYCDPIFISPLSDGVLCTVGNDSVPANRTVIYGGIAWYWSTVNNGVGGSYDDSEGNMLTYPGSIGSDGYSASGGISPNYIRQILEYVHASAWEDF